MRGRRLASKDDRVCHEGFGLGFIHRSTVGARVRPALVGALALALLAAGCNQEACFVAALLVLPHVLGSSSRPPTAASWWSI